ncbi:Condensin complex subunit 2 [Phytophthora cinnamomi]|uniref:Condensin complex subunit 2 n=1 Tax=Phytophthora cinnamomi TaxID=4785 RepID=UPI00355AAD64|nr:Condensin complex subunit 2 [Phytophthora cinnamomi]
MAPGGEAKSDDGSDVEQYELTEDEEEQEQAQDKAQDQDEATPAKRATGKRKRSLSQNDEEELARRRRRRRSLAFQQRRRSLTPSERKAAATGAAGGAAAAPAHSKQYISDMYSTIIKMSSENKINVKNSWSLHLIDHMEDILDSSKKIAADGDDDTYNFQKASCTLDASIKIYSYRVDDTWNSSYKILENLSRTEQKHGAGEATSDEERGATTARKTRKTHARTIEKNLNNINLKSYDTECEADPLFHKMSQSFDEGGAKGMLLANLSVYDGCKILLNSSDVSLVTRKPIHGAADASQKEESKPKKKKKPGKNSADGDKSASGAEASDEAKKSESVEAETEDKTNEKDEETAEKEGDSESHEKEDGDKTPDEKQDGDAEDKPEERDGDVTMEEEQDKDKEDSSEDATAEVNKEGSPEDELDKSKEDSSGDVTTEEDQGKEGGSSDAAEATNEEENGDKPPAAKERISLTLFGNLSCIDEDVQNLSVCPPLYRMYDQLDEFYGDESRHKLGIKNDFLLTTPVKGRRKTLDKQDAITMNLAGIMEHASEDESDAEDAAQETAFEFADDNADYDADEDGGDTVGEPDEPAEVDPADDVDMEKEKDIIDLAGSDDEGSAEGGDLTPEETESGAKALDTESSLTSSAADFFRAKVNENLPENYENNLFSQMIESALVRSATLDDEQGGDDKEGKNDYSYFDVKMLRNWAGPGHWKFPGVRKVQVKHKEEAEKDGLEVDDDGVIIKAEPNERPPERLRKGSTVGAEKKAVVLIDFFGEEPDLSRLKAPKSASTLEVTKGNLKKQSENASDLVLPVDTHIEIGLFFRHFLKEKPRFFRKRGGGVLDGAHREGAASTSFEFGDSSADTVDDNDRDQPFTYNEDSTGFEGGYDDEDESTSVADDPSTEPLYSVEGLVQADRVVEKIGVHYERFAKRVDVKKLKGSIWDHLEKKVVKNGERTGSKANSAETTGETDQTSTDSTVNESGKRPREPEKGDEDDNAETLDTTFENVVENVAGKVPSNVTVSFYFICVLHLANEKGLQLVGQDDLRNFQIRKEN